MRKIIGGSIGFGIAALMIFIVKSLPLELQGSLGLLIGLSVGLGFWRIHSAVTSKERGEA